MLLLSRSALSAASSTDAPLPARTVSRRLIQAPRLSAPLRALLTFAILIASITLPVTAAEAAANRTFQNTYAATIHGDIAEIGNANSTCNPSWTPSPACDTNSTTLNNSSKGYGVLVDTDGDGSTTNSSSSTVAIPSGATIAYARLTWGATGDNTDNNGEETVKFDTPQEPTINYRSVTADYATRCGGFSAASANRGFACSADVTALVQAAGSGQYTVGSIEQRPVGSGADAIDHWSGWALYIVYEKPSEQLRRVVLSDGFLRVANGVATSPISISGFIAPANNTVRARLVYAAGEGDAGITGDNATLNSTTLDPAATPDLMNSSNAGHTYQTSRNPSFNNQYGFDVDSQVVNGAIPNGATSTTFTFTTNGDTYYPFSLGVAIDLEEPKVVLTKSLSDLNGGVVESGDILEYTILAKNEGDDGATDVVMTDNIPTNTTYVPGSMEVTQGANLGVKTDAAGDDQAFYDSGLNRVTMYLGTGANASTGGALGINADTTVKFRVLVDNNIADGTPVTNTANGAYKGQTALFSYANPSTIASTPIRRADLTVTQEPGTLVAGQSSDITLTANNIGGASTRSNTVTLTTSVPSGVTFGAITSAVGWTCSTASLPTITCTRSDSLAANSSYPDVKYSVVPSQSASSATFTATVSGGNQLNTSNDSDTDSPAITRQADLRVTTIASAATANVGDTVTFTINGRNLGPSTTTGVAVTGTLPAGLQLSTATLGGSGCSIVGQGFTCTAGALGVGDASADTQTILVTAVVQASAAGTTRTLTPSIAGNDPDPVSGNNTASASVSINPAADVQLTETRSPATVDPGSNITFTFTATNNGPSAAAGVTLTDTLPAGITVQSVTPSQGICGTATPGSPFSCALGSLANGASATVVVVVRPTLAAANTTITNPGSVSATTFDQVAGNNSATASATVNPAADLRTTVAVAPATATVGDAVDYTFTVHNDGPSNAAGATLQLNLPAGVTIQSITPSQGTCPASGNPRTCAVGGIANGATATVTVRVVPTAAAAGTSPAITATAGTTTYDQTPSNDAATGSVSVNQAADLELTETVSPSPANVGNDVTYTFTVKNNGPGAATGVVLTDDLPAGAIVQSITTSKGTCGTGDPFSCTLGGLANGQTETVTVVIRPATATAGTTLANPGTLTSSSYDPSPADNSASASLTVNPAADLRTTATVDAPTSNVGDTVTYLVTVANDGPSGATGVSTIVDLPNGATVVSVTPSQGACGAGDPRTCTLGGLPSGSSATIEVKVTLTPANASGAVTLSADASATQYDQTPGNNSASASTTAGDAADLEITQTVAPNPANPGSDVTYTLTVRNNGPDAAAGVVVTDDLPAGATVVSITPSQGTCGTGDPFTCPLGTIASGATATVTVVVRPQLSAAGTALVNTASVSTTTVDPSSSNNSSTGTGNVNPAADLRVAASVDSPTATVGSTRNYLLTVTNDGPSTANGAQLLVDLPAGATILSVTPSQGSCPASGDPRSCTLGTISSGASATVAVAVRVEAANASSPVTVSGEASATTFDPSSTNDTASASSSAGAAADLRITKTADKTTANVGDTITWTITPRNFGPDTALGTTVTDAIPAGVTITSATSTVGTCAVGSSVSCSVGSLAGGAQAVITVVGRVERAAAGSPVGGQASVTGSVFDPDTSNNVSAATTTNVGPAADLRVVNLVDNPNPRAGDTVTWTIQVFNDGPSAAAGVQLGDVVPAGVTITGVTTTGGSCSQTGQNVACAIGTVGAGASQTVRITGQIPAGSAGGPINNTASATSSTQDPDPSNNTSTANGTAAGAANLSITLTPDRDTATVGERITWTGVIGNGGPQTATGVVVTLELPEGMTDVTATTPGGTCTVSGRTVTCQVTDVAAGTSGGVTISGIVTRAAAEKSLVLTGTVAGNETDPAPADNTGNGRGVAVAPAVDLHLEKSASRAEVAVGDQLTVTSEISNRGPSAATDVIVVDDLPEGVELVNVTPSQGSCTVVGQRVTCNLGRLADGEKATINTVVVVRSAGAGQKLLSGGTVTSAEFDTNNADNSAAVDAVGVKVADAPAIDTPAPAPFIDLTKTVDNASPAAGDAVVYTITATNRGNAPATGVRVVDALPAGLTYKSTKVTGGTCTRSARTVTCTTNTLAVGQSLVVKITTVVEEPGKVIANTASVIANGLPATPTKGQLAAASLKASGGPFVFAAIKPATTARAGKTVRIAVKVTNTGLGTARDAQACFTLPSSVVLVRKPAGLTQKGTKFCLSAAALAAGKNKRVVILARVVGPVGSRLRPTLTASASNAKAKTEAYAIQVRGTTVATRGSGVTG